ncbi:MAG: dipeptide epimerase [Nocardioidaceae bacterium]|nr:dipeptide epimerase [Nocardioidaceae bacterium]
MTVTEVSCRRLTAALHSPFVTALRSTRALETLVVEIVDADGVRGVGEAPQVWRVTGESLAGAEACVLGPLRDVVVGRSPDDLTDLLRELDVAVVGNFGAKSAVDVALHDLTARRLGVSLPQLLGTTTHRVDTDVTVSAGSVDQLSTDAKSRTADGFTALKLKVGTDAATDVSRVVAVRDAVGPDVRIRVDANQGWTARQAIRVIRELEDADADLEFVEQPVPAHDLEGLARVTAAVDTPVMADEAVFGVRDLSALIARGAADLVNVKLAKCGGLAAARTMLDLAAAHGVGTLVGSMMEGPIGVGAASSLVASHPTTVTSDLDAAWWLSASPVRGGLVYDAGTITLPAGPGLDIEGWA